MRQLLGWEEENQESNRPLLTEEGLANVPLKVDDAQSIVESNDSIVNVSGNYILLFSLYIHPKNQNKTQISEKSPENPETLKIS